MLSWRWASHAKGFNKEILKKILGDKYRDSSHRVVAWDGLRMEMRNKNVCSKQSFSWRVPMVVYLKWKCTGTPILAVKDHPSSYRVKAHFGNSSQSQMSSYSPPSPPPRRKKGGVPMIGDAWKRVGTG